MELRNKLLKKLFRLFDDAQYEKFEYAQRTFYIVGKVAVCCFLNCKEESIDVKVCMFEKDKVEEEFNNLSYTYSWNFTVSSTTSLIGHIKPILAYIEEDGYELNRKDLLLNAEEFKPRNYVKAAPATLKQFKYASNIINIAESDATNHGFIVKDVLGNITWMPGDSFHKQYMRELPCTNM